MSRLEMSDELEQSLRDGNMEELAKIVSLQAENVRSIDHQTNTPLHLAAYYHRNAAVEFLLARGGHTPLHMSLVLPGGESTVAILLKAGSNPNARNNSSATALHLAALHPNPQSIHMLLKAHVDRSVRTLDGKTAANVAEQAGNMEVLALLV